MRAFAFTLALLGASPALAATPVTYVFKAVVEYGDGPGTVPNPASLGTVGIIKVTVDTSAVGSFTSNTATYVGGYACGNGQPSPILSVTFSREPGTNLGDGSCDEIIITKDVNGQSAITMQSASEEVGTTFSASFTTNSATAIASLSIPKKIITTDFQRSFFVLNPVISQNTMSGDMVTR